MAGGELQQLHHPGSYLSVDPKRHSRRVNKAKHP
jgi:hypothetical protein